MTNSTNNKSINWINIVKALSIIFVYFVHCQLYYGCVFYTINKFVYPWYVNAFFFVSGYLLFWKQLSEPKILEERLKYAVGGGNLLVKNIIYRIAIPSILFSLIEFLPSSLIQGRGIELSNLLYKTVGGQTYWFTSALVVAELMILLMLFTRRKNIWFYMTISILIGFCGIWMAQNGVAVFSKNWWAYRQGLIAVMFLAFGGVFWRYEQRLQKILKWYVCFVLMVVMVATILLCDNTDPLISTLTIQPLGIVTSLIACVLLVQLCKLLPEVKPLTFIGQNSIGFYFLSGALPITIGLIARKLGAGDHAWLMLVIWILCLAIAIVAVQVINRQLPWLWDLRRFKK